MINNLRQMSQWKYKNVKSFYYLKEILLLLVPRTFYRLILKSELKKIENYDREYILSRVNYYNRKVDQFNVSENATSLSGLKYTQIKNIIGNLLSSKKDGLRKTYNTYFLDLHKHFSFFPSRKKLDLLFGDVTTIPNTPSIVKSRPILDNENSIIMKLNKVRHFHFIDDERNFKDKKDMAVWRGNGMNSTTRKHFLENYYSIPIFNIGQRSPVIDKPWFKGFMSIYDQLAYKFIFCIEGVDTATSIKWVMSSNSVCLMPKPKYETWFMEGKLQANIHYIEVNEDFSDAEEKIKYYIKNQDEALKIIKNANSYVNQFKNLKREKLISLLVMDKYFSLSGQNNE